MKKILILLFSALIPLCATLQAGAQNLQVLYDAERNCVTSTIEMFRPDSFGNTYFFVDMDSNPKVSGAYWEISREFNFWQDTDLSWLSAHIEYNGGLSTSAGSFNNCWLGGVTYSGHSEDFSKTWSLSALYKAIPGTVGLNGQKQVHNFQITGVWGISFADGWCDFSGFFDFWREARVWQGTEFIFITEPQLWLNLNKLEGWDDINISVGGELEISSNFVDKGFHILPAFGARWTF